MGGKDCNADSDESTPTGNEEELPYTEEKSHRQRVRKEGEEPLRRERGRRHFNRHHVRAQLWQVDEDGMLELDRSDVKFDNLI